MTAHDAWMPFVEPAPAKINLFLQVNGRRNDGYHDLESLVVFSAFGDALHLQPAAGLSLERTGPFATQLPDNPDDDLCLQAARTLAAALGRDPGVTLTLEKNIPVAAGIGGGSSDAAAVLRALCRVWQTDVGDPQVRDIAGQLGADVPVCLLGTTAEMRGIGDVIVPRSDDPELNLLLVNPNRPLSTASVFDALLDSDMTTVSLADPEPPGDAEAYLDIVSGRRNDLTRPACDLCPEIGDVLTALSGLVDCRLARMSGSGPTCFGVFDGPESCARAAAQLSDSHPGWWVCPTRTRAGF